MNWFAEVKTSTGWSPRTYLDMPVEKDGRLHTLSGPGLRVRNIKKVPDSMKASSLDHLQRQLGGDS